MAPTPQTIDRYGRTVEEVIGVVNLNLALVDDGMAYPLRGVAGAGRVMFDSEGMHWGRALSSDPC